MQFKRWKGSGILPLRSLWLVLLFCLPAFLFAQKEANWWYFGNKVGLDFNSGSPTPYANGGMVATEGCASIAHRNTGLFCSIPMDPRFGTVTMLR
ncbi:hypothetical protein KFE98_06450 [bacterium SCSIO 12741]|nr:hypothetical protein KFE98_06450 [bacterium SCSIO 12741]